MCSTVEQRIAEFGHAIDDLAADAHVAYARAASRPPEAAARFAADLAGPEAAGAAGPGAAGQAELRAAGQAGPGAARDADPVVIRLAQLWEQLAELDPEIARRLPTYEA